MANLNKVMLIGNLTRDPEKRYTPSGTCVTTFTLAINRSWKGSNGEKKEETTFVRIVVWEKMAENCSEYLFKGSSCFVEGRLMIRSYDDGEGVKKYITEVVAQTVQFLDRRKRQTEAQSESQQNDSLAIGPDVIGDNPPF